jgi:hypothetical protein
LKFMREKWAHPRHHLLSVRLGQVPFEAIPPYLRSVTVLEPEGDVAAEVASAVAGWTSLAQAGAVVKTREPRVLDSTGRGRHFVFVVALMLIVATGLGWMMLRPGVRPADVVTSNAVTTQAAGSAAELLRKLSDANVLTSVGPAVMQNWLELPDEKYRHVAEATLTLLKGGRLKHPVNLDVIFYKYALVLGLKSEDDLPSHPTIDASVLQRALVWAYNEENGTDVKIFDDIIEASG